MNTRITVKKVGNHWYPDIQHEFADEIELDEKIERVLNFLDKNKYDNLNQLPFPYQTIYSYLLTIFLFAYMSFSLNKLIYSHLF